MKFGKGLLTLNEILQSGSYTTLASATQETKKY